VNRRVQPWYAAGGRQLLETRRAGQMPEGPVSVILAGDSIGGGVALRVHDDTPLERLDWRMLVNLPVWLLATPAVPLERVLRVARDIAAVRPARLTLRFHAGEQRHDVDVGSGRHIAAFDVFPPHHEFTWHPMDLTYTQVGAQLCRALVRELPMWSTL
jgi:hypothetical protein